MVVKQISVFIENKKGRLHSLTKALGENNIDLIALSIADTTDFGILRFISSDTDTALKVIRDNGFTAKLTDVLAVEVPDKPGGLEGILVLLDESNIGIEYLYSFVRLKGKSALIMFRVDDTAKAMKILESNGVRLLGQREINAL